MDHSEYIRVSDSKKTAVLMIHGILGTPRHFDCFMDTIPKDWSIYNILLDGHGKGVADFSRTSMDKWKKQVLRHMIHLNRTYEEIIIMGHSMGTLLGIEAYFLYPEKVKFMVLLNVPLKVHLKLAIVKSSLKIVFKTGELDQETAEMKWSGSIQTNRKLWQYLGWTPRYLELFQLIRKTRARIDKIKIPTYTFQSGRDELVSNKAIPYLEMNPVIHNRVMEDSGHFGYRPLDLVMMKRTVRQVFEGGA